MARGPSSLSNKMRYAAPSGSLYLPHPAFGEQRRQLISVTIHVEILRSNWLVRMANGKEP